MESSTTFIAYLPDMSVEHLAKLYTWASKSCVKSDLVSLPSGQMKIVGVRAEPRSLRTLQRLLRTNLLNWGVELPPSQPGWLKLIREEDYEKEKDQKTPDYERDKDQKTPDAAPLLNNNGCRHFFRTPVNLLLTLTPTA